MKAGGLHEIRCEGILEQQRHGAVRIDVGGPNRLLVTRVAENDAAEPCFQIRGVGCEREHRHDLGRGGDHEAFLARDAIAGAAETDRDVAQRTIVHVHASLPCNAADIEVQQVPLLQMIVEHRRQQRVRGRDRVEITREVQVDVFHRNDLRVTAAGRTALDAEDRSETRLAQCENDLVLAAP
jgi:hypothetical protein